MTFVKFSLKIIICFTYHLSYTQRSIFLVLWTGFVVDSKMIARRCSCQKLKQIFSHSIFSNDLFVWWKSFSDGHIVLLQMLSNKCIQRLKWMSLGFKRKHCPCVRLNMVFAGFLIDIWRGCVWKYLHVSLSCVTSTVIPSYLWCDGFVPFAISLKQILPVEWVL